VFTLIVQILSAIGFNDTVSRWNEESWNTLLSLQFLDWWTCRGEFQSFSDQCLVDGLRYVFDGTLSESIIRFLQFAAGAAVFTWILGGRSFSKGLRRSGYGLALVFYFVVLPLLLLVFPSVLDLLVDGLKRIDMGRPWNLIMLLAVMGLIGYLTYRWEKGYTGPSAREQAFHDGVVIIFVVGIGTLVTTFLLSIPVLAIVYLVSLALQTLFPTESKAAVMTATLWTVLQGTAGKTVQAGLEDFAKKLIERLILRR
jgi:hypothetical protein